MPCRYPHATYAAMISYFDEQVGKLLDKLKKDGLYDNTLIVYTSDNGPTFNGGSDSLGLIVEVYSIQSMVGVNVFCMKEVYGFRPFLYGLEK